MKSEEAFVRSGAARAVGESEDPSLIPLLEKGTKDFYPTTRQFALQGISSLSRKKAKLLNAWATLVDSHENGTIINGHIISKTKGGLIVDCGGLETFLPGSQLVVCPCGRS